MAKFEGCYLTDSGLRLCSKIGTNTVNFTKAVTGSGSYTSTNEIKQLASLKNQQQEFEITDFMTLPDYEVSVIFYINNMGLLHDYNLTEIGLYAKDTDGSEILYCVAIALDENADIVPKYDDEIEYSARMTINTVISTDAVVKINFREEDHEWTAAYVKGQLSPVITRIEKLEQKTIQSIRDINLLKQTVDLLLQQNENLEKQVSELRKIINPDAPEVNSHTETLIFKHGCTYDEPTETILIDDESSTIEGELLRLKGGVSENSGYHTLPVASTQNLGCVMIGDGIDVEPDGTISANFDSAAELAAELAAEMIEENTEDYTDEEIDEMMNSISSDEK